MDDRTSNRYGLAGGDPVSYVDLDGHQSFYFSAHEAAVGVTAFRATAEFMRLWPGHRGRVTVRRRHNLIRGAAYKAHKGDNGYPDIILRNQSTRLAHIWEVKSDSPSQVLKGRRQLFNYVWGFAGTHPGWWSTYGFRMKPRSVYFWALWRVNVRSSASLGLEIYNREKTGRRYPVWSWSPEQVEAFARALLLTALAVWAINQEKDGDLVIRCSCGVTFVIHPNARYTVRQRR